MGSVLSNCQLSIDERWRGEFPGLAISRNDKIQSACSEHGMERLEGTLKDALPEEITYDDIPG